MSLENIQLHFLWHLFRLYFINGSRKDAMSLVATMYDHPLDLPEKLESLLLNYWESGSDATLIEAAVTTAKKFYFDAERHVMLVAILVEMKTINIDEAASLLISNKSKFGLNEREESDVIFVEIFLSPIEVFKSLSIKYCNFFSIGLIFSKRTLYFTKRFKTG